MKKRLLSILLVLVMALSVLPTAAFAEDGGENLPACICETACTAEEMLSLIHISEPTRH